MKLHALALRRDHAHDRQISGKVQLHVTGATLNERKCSQQGRRHVGRSQHGRPPYLRDAVEELLEVRLHAVGLAGFRQDVEQLVVRQEEETRKVHALLLQIVQQPSIDLFQRRHGVLQAIQYRCTTTTATLTNNRDPTQTSVLFDMRTSLGRGIAQSHPRPRKNSDSVYHAHLEC